MMRVENVSFYSDGARLVGELHLPPGHPDEKFPVVVRCQGWGSVRTQRITEYLGLIDHGMAVLSFDFRGYGDSEGLRDRLFPQDIAADIRAAVTFLRQHPAVDSRRIAALGLLTGASAALHAMSQDPHIAAAVCLFPFGNGARWMRRLRSNWEWHRFIERVDEDRRRRVGTGKAEVVDPNEILIRDPVALKHESALRARSDARRTWRLGLDSADAIMSFRPEDHVHRIGPRPVFCVTVEEDVLMPLEEVMDLYAKLTEPKDLLILRGIRHHQIYEPDRVAWLNARFADFLRNAFDTKLRSASFMDSPPMASP